MRGISGWSSSGSSHVRVDGCSTAWWKVRELEEYDPGKSFVSLNPTCGSMYQQVRSNYPLFSR